MTEIPISPTIWMLAAAILTEKQLAVLELREKRGYSWNMLAITFNSTKATMREHHRAATKNLLDAIENAGGIEAALAANTDLEAACESSSSPSPTSTSSSPHSAKPPESKTPEPCDEPSSTSSTESPDESTSSSSQTQPSLMSTSERSESTCKKIPRWSPLELEERRSSRRGRRET
jgi:hypothetical protein